MQFQWLMDGAPIARTKAETFLTTLGTNARQLRDMEYEAVVAGVSEGLSCGSHVFKVQLADPHYIESDGISGNGHRFGCHIFVCSGCPLPPGFCDCDCPPAEARNILENLIAASHN